MLIDPDAGAEIVAPLFMTQFFGHFASDQAPVYMPGAPFFAAGVLGLLAILISQRVMTIAESTA
jgi:DHA1 family tetracycline resistance protein-like MFS transporter